MKVDIIAIDLDDTLLRTDLTISERNRRVIAAASAAGIRVVLASGRNYHSMRDYAEVLGLIGPGDYMICSNGAEIIHSPSGRVLDERRLEPGFCREVAGVLDSRGLPWSIYEDGIIHVNRPNPWAYEDAKLTGQPTILMEDRDELFTRGLVKIVVPGEPEILTPLVLEFQALFGDRAIVLTSKPFFLEVLPPGADKGLALERLAAMLDLPMSGAMAIGDGMNDLGMVRASGYGCAPANANPDVRAAARYISSRTNEEDAVADLIESVALSA